MKPGSIRLNLKTALACCGLLLPILTWAETAYVIDKIEVGLHTENSIESPITQLVTTGTELEILQRGVDFSEVKTLAGVTGWINSTYLVDEQPGAIEAANVSTTELDAAKQEIETLRQQLATTNETEATEQLKAMRLKVGELQAQLTQQRIENNSHENNEELYERIAQVEQEKIALENTIIELKNPAGEGSDLGNLYSHLGASKLLLYFIIVLIIGAAVGIFVFDFINRQRHGGFRI